MLDSEIDIPVVTISYAEGMRMKNHCSGLSVVFKCANSGMQHSRADDDVRSANPLLTAKIGRITTNDANEPTSSPLEGKGWTTEEREAFFGPLLSEFE